LDLSRIPDGTYHGVSREGKKAFQVEVILERQRIVNIEIINKNAQTNKRCQYCQAEDLIEEVVRGQSLEVDAVSSATPESPDPFIRQ
jgi:uncharacterized protein with FMN-binding domain